MIKGNDKGQRYLATLLMSPFDEPPK